MKPNMEQVYTRKGKRKTGKRKMDVDDKEEKYDTEGKLRDLSEPYLDMTACFGIDLYNKSRLY